MCTSNSTTDEEDLECEKKLVVSLVVNNNEVSSSSIFQLPFLKSQREEAQ